MSDIELLHSVILDHISAALVLAQKFHSSKHEELVRALEPMVKAGVGEHRIREACKRLSLVEQALVLDALDSLMRPTSTRLGEDLDDPHLLIAYTDAGCHPNPGPGVCGVILLKDDGTEIGRYRRELGHVSSNEAE